MKLTVKGKQPFKPKPGSLKATHIEYGEGDSASVRHEHHRDPAKMGMMMHEPEPLAKHFGSRMEAHHHAAQMAGVPTTMDDEEEAEQQDQEMYPQGNPSRKPKPAPNPPNPNEAGGAV